MKKEKKKLPYNVFKKGITAGVLGFAMLMGGSGLLVGCGEPGATGAKGDKGNAGINGATWYSGTQYSANEGAVGDFFFDTDDQAVYQKTATGWVFVTSIKGQAGNDGTDVYVGYDGQIWRGSEKESFTAGNVSLPTSVVESTIGIEGVMSKYFAGSYVDLSTDTIALMANYMPTAKLTQYGESIIKQIKVVAENAGTLHIGKAKVADIVAARLTGATLTTTTTSYEVVAGLNTLNIEIELDNDETVVLGGKGSTAKLYVAKGIRTTDEHGNFSLVNGEENLEVIAETEDIQDTLAIQVSANHKKDIPVFSGVKNITCTNTVSDTAGPYAYQNSDLFSGKKISKIGMYVMSLENAVTEDQTMTVFIVDKTATSGFKNGTPITVTVPASEFTGCNASAVNKWVYATDFRDAEGNPLDGIVLDDDETIAFGASTATTGIVDSINWGYSSTTLADYSFWTNGGVSGGANLVFDIYTESMGEGLGTRLSEIEEQEAAAIWAGKMQALRTALSGKKISFLGDSITTFAGYSNINTVCNDATTPLSNNAVFYSGSNYGITDVNQTWWMQTVNEAGLDLLVNNAFSGDKVTVYGDERCVLLHDNTTANNPENKEINPDLIAVYLGINDFDGNVLVATFETAYRNMIAKMVAKYTAADVYLFTLVPNKTRVDDVTMKQYNAIIRTVATEYGCTVVDLYADSGITADNCSQYMSDAAALHPNQLGMDLMTDCFIRKLVNNYVNN